MDKIVKELNEIKEKILIGTVTAKDADNINAIVSTLKKKQAAPDAIPSQEALFVPEGETAKTVIYADCVTINHFAPDTSAEEEK